MKNILEYLEATACRCPDHIAVRDPESACTYLQLHQAARCIGSGLSAHTPPRRPIAVYMDKSVLALQTMLGIVYAGCFYIFLNPDQPLARIEQILDVVGADCLLTDQPQVLTDLHFSGRIFHVGNLLTAQENPEKLLAIAEQSLDIDPLYCNFTSGSTGIPKGVLVSHRSVIDFISCFTDLFQITGQDVLGNQAPFDFDVSVKDIYSALKTGATLVLIPRKMFCVITRLMDYLSQTKVTTLIWAVSALCLVAQFKGLSYRVPEHVNKILFSGELMPVRYLLQWQAALPRAVFVNLYGPTEITCNCTYYIIDRPFAPQEQIPIGTSFPNESVFLLDDADTLITQPNKSGELCVSGTALALGYYNNPDQTAKAFVQHPCNTAYPQRIYRTGDLAYYNAQGQLCFAGRKDFQIKYMGHRIELEEIETALHTVAQVNRACCAFEADKNRIVAFYSGAILPNNLKKALYEKLPAYMIPSIFYHMEKLPITANGKIDRTLLRQTGGI